MQWRSLKILPCLGIREVVQKYTERAGKLESEDTEDTSLLAGGRILGESLNLYTPEIPYL